MEEDELAKKLFHEFEKEEDNIKSNIDEAIIPTKEPMKVYLRIRPLDAKELEAKEDQGCIILKDEETVEIRAPSDSFTFKSSIRGLNNQTHQFSFSRVFNENTMQKQFFDDTMLPFVKDVLDGQNGLVFTYGVTNSGKTYTIQGTPKDGGILPRALDVIFNSISNQKYARPNLKPKHCNDIVRLSPEEEARETAIRNAVFIANEKENIDVMNYKLFNSTTKTDASVGSSNNTLPDLSMICPGSRPGSANSTQLIHSIASIDEELKQRVSDQTIINVAKQGNVRFGVWVSFFEIYNELMYDLLDLTPIGKGKKRRTLKMGEDKVGNPYVKGLTQVFVTSSDEAYKVLRLGQKNRHIAATRLNQMSSRSHCIFTIKLLKIVDVDQPHVARITRLSIVDLAGSERYCKTGAAGELLKEASNINLSIMTLGKCINYLRYNQVHSSSVAQIIPFRESKLTRLFQSFFLGKGQASMIVNISQCASVFDETYNVMKFSAVAKQIKMKAERATEFWKAPLLQKIVSTPAAVARPPLCIVTPATTSKKRTLDDPTAFSYDELAGLVGQLRDKVKKERKEKSLLEKTIREEVVREMNELIIEIENSHSVELVEQKQLLEDTMDKRIEVLTKAANKTRKRKKVGDDDDDSYVSSVLLHAEKMKVKERDESIISLEAKINELENESRLLKNSQTPEQQSKLVEILQKELYETNEALAEANEALETQKDEILRMQLVIQNKNDEIDHIRESDEDSEEKSTVELQHLLENTVKELEAACVKLDDRDRRIKELESMVSTQKVQDEKLAKHVSQLEEWHELCKQKNEFLLTEKEECLKFSEEQRCNVLKLTNEVQSLSATLKESRESCKLLQFQNDEICLKLDKYETLFKEHQEVLSDNENIIDDLNKKLSELQTLHLPNNKENITKETNKDETCKLHEDLKKSEEKVNEYSEKIMRLEKQLKCSETASTLSLKSTKETPDKKVLINKKSYITPVKKHFNSSTPLRSPRTPSSNANQQTIKNLEKMLSESTKALERKTNEVVTKHNKIQQLELRINGFEKKTAINDVIADRDELKKQVLNLNRELDELHETYDQLQFRFDNQLENTEGLELEVNNLSSIVKNYEAKVSELSVELDLEKSQSKAESSKHIDEINKLKKSKLQIKTEFDLLESDNLKLTFQLKKVEDELSALKCDKLKLADELAKKTIEIQDYKNTLATKDHLAQSLEHKQQLALGEAKKLTRELEDRRKSRVFIETSLENVQGTYEKRIQDLHKELEETEDEVKQLKMYVLELEMKCQMRENLLEETKSKVYANNRELEIFKATYDARVDEYNKENEHLRKLKNESEVAQEKFTIEKIKLESDIKTLQEEIVDLKIKQKHQQTVESALNEYERMEKLWNIEKKENYTTILKLEEELQELRVINGSKNKNKINDKVDELEKLQARYEKEVCDYKTDIMLSKEILSKVEKEKDDLKDRLITKENELKRAQDEKKVALEELKQTIKMNTKPDLKRILQENIAPSIDDNDPEFVTPSKKKNSRQSRDSSAVKRSLRTRKTPDVVSDNEKIKTPCLDSVKEISSSPAIAADDVEEMVDCVSIALSPINVGDFEGDVAETNDEHADNDEGCEYVIGDFVALRSYASRAAPILGQISTIKKKSIQVQLLEGGYSKQWKEMLDQNGERTIRNSLNHGSAAPVMCNQRELAEVTKVTRGRKKLLKKSNMKMFDCSPSVLIEPMVTLPREKQTDIVQRAHLMKLRRR